MLCENENPYLDYKNSEHKNTMEIEDNESIMQHYTFIVKDFIVFDSSIIFIFNVKPSNKLLLPYCKINYVTQNSKRINTSIKKINNSRVLENKTTLNTISAKIKDLWSFMSSGTLVASDLECVIFKTLEGGCIEINNNTNTLIYKNAAQMSVNCTDFICLTPLNFNNREFIDIKAEMKDIINVEFYHIITNYTEDSKFPAKSSGYYLEQSIILENMSPFEFDLTNSNFRVIIADIDLKEKCEQDVHNIIFDMELEEDKISSIGIINSFSRDSYVFSEIKLEDPIYYTIISSINNTIETVKEFTLNRILYPGIISVYQNSTVLLDTMKTNYKNTGEKIFIKDFSNKSIKIVSSLFLSDSFTIDVENTSEEVQYIKIDKYPYIAELRLNNVLVKMSPVCEGSKVSQLSDMFDFPTGITSIKGFYKT